MARLARIRLAPPEVAPLKERLSSILTWVEHLSEVPTDQVDPMFSLFLEKMPMRPDEITEENRVSDVLSNAPESALGMYAVPKVVE